MNSFVFRRALAVAQKEFYHILRDPFTLSAAIGLPIFMVVLFGVAIEFNIQNISLAVSNQDHSMSSSQLLDTFSSSHYFLIKPVNSPRDAVATLTFEQARATLIIPLDFEKNIFANRSSSVQVLLDGSDSSTVAPVLGYLGRIQNIANERIANLKQKAPYQIDVRYLFNPELSSKWFVIPGLNVMVMGILSILLTALTIAREYENGSMELLLSTPIQPLEIIVGKLAPYALIGLGTVTLIYFIARLAFGIPFVGSHWVFALGAILFLTAYLAQGLLISVTTRNQQVAMQLSMMVGMLPTQLLSGFVFPIESMSPVLQYVTMLLPARWFMQISRDIFLEGSSLRQLSVPFLAMTIFTIVVISLGKRKFKRDLEP